LASGRVWPEIRIHLKIQRSLLTRVVRRLDASTRRAATRILAGEGCRVSSDGIFAGRNYHGLRTHLRLAKEMQDSLPVDVPALDRIDGMPRIGGPHHPYEQRAA